MAGLVVAVFLAVSWLKFELVDGGGRTLPVDLPNGVITVRSLGHAPMDVEWLPVLRYGKIVHCSPFNTADAFADKFIVYFEDGRKAMLKLMERRSLFDRGLRTVSWDPCVLYRPNDHVVTSL